MQRRRCLVLEVVVFLGVANVDGSGFFAGCEQLQFDDVFGQAGVSSGLVVLSQDVFVSHSACPPVCDACAHCSPRF